MKCGTLVLPENGQEFLQVLSEKHNENNLVADEAEWRKRIRSAGDSIDMLHGESVMSGSISDGYSLNVTFGSLILS